MFIEHVTEYAKELCCIFILSLLFLQKSDVYIKQWKKFVTGELLWGPTFLFTIKIYIFETFLLTLSGINLP